MKKPLVSGIRIHCILACLVVVSAIAPAQVSAQAPAASLANTPNPELVGMLTKELNRGGRGDLFEGRGRVPREVGCNGV